MIDLYLSSDGKHTVHVAAESAEELNELAGPAKALYEGIIKTYGNKAQMWESAMKAEAQAAKNPGPAKAGAPLCPVHKQPMHLRQGKFGPFWSCSQKQPSGQWCSQTKETRTPDDMPVKIAE